jgi:hypothetical protein
MPTGVQHLHQQRSARTGQPRHNGNHRETHLW